jgi:hypothetical protein
MADKSGNWFLELILNILIISSVAFVTFQAHSEQARGIGVPLFAAVSGGAKSVGQSLGTGAENPPAATALPAGGNSAAGGSPVAPSETFLKAWGALQIWAAGLDGKITQSELDQILATMKNGWDSTGQSARDYLKTINDRINQGQADAVLKDAFQTIARQAADKKTEVLASLTRMMQANGVSWDKIQSLVAQWSQTVFQGVSQTAQKLVH